MLIRGRLVRRVGTRFVGHQIERAVPGTVRGISGEAWLRGIRLSDAWQIRAQTREQREPWSARSDRKRSFLLVDTGSGPIQGTKTMSEALTITHPALFPQTCLSPASRRGRRICLLVAAIWMMNAFDLFMTLHAHGHGLLAETNPIARYLLVLGPPALALFKILFAGFGGCVLLWNRHHALAEYMAWLAAGVNLSVAVRWMSCYEFYQVTVNHGVLPTEIFPALGAVL